MGAVSKAVKAVIDTAFFIGGILQELYELHKLPIILPKIIAYKHVFRYTLFIDK